MFVTFLGQRLLDKGQILFLANRKRKGIKPVPTPYMSYRVDHGIVNAASKDDGGKESCCCCVDLFLQVAYIGAFAINNNAGRVDNLRAILTNNVLVNGIENKNTKHGRQCRNMSSSIRHWLDKVQVPHVDNIPAKKEAGRPRC